MVIVEPSAVPVIAAETKGHLTEEAIGALSAEPN